MKILKLLFIPIFICLISCDGGYTTEGLSLDKDGVQTYLDVNEQAIIKINSGSGKYTVSIMDESIINAQIKGNIITINPLKLGKTLMTIKDSKGETKEVPVGVYLLLNAGEWVFQEYIVDIACSGDNTIYNAINSEIQKNLIQCDKAGIKKPSTIIFKTPNSVKMDSYKADILSIKSGNYIYDYSNLKVQLTNGENMNLVFSGFEGAGYWGAYLSQDLTDKYIELYGKKVTNVLVKYTLQARMLP